MEMCRFESATVSGYSDFKAALADYLSELRVKKFAQQETEQGKSAQQAGSYMPELSNTHGV
jgi:DNA-binding MurR/RpiR family transcriptional regulator